MRLQPMITFHDVDPSPALQQRIEQRIARLDRLHPNLTACRVAVELERLHGRQGHRYRVRVDVTAPGHEVLAGREPREHRAHEDAFVAVRDAFDAVERRIEDLAREQRGDVKTHQPEAHGTVAEIDPVAGRGRIETRDGRSIYFHRNSVGGERFDTLHPGSAVRFVEEAGEDGPQASTVVPLGHHLV